MKPHQLLEDTVITQDEVKATFISGKISVELDSSLPYTVEPGEMLKKYLESPVFSKDDDTARRLWLVLLPKLQLEDFPLTPLSIVKNYLAFQEEYMRENIQGTARTYDFHFDEGRVYTSEYWVVREARDYSYDISSLGFDYDEFEQCEDLEEIESALRNAIYDAYHDCESNMIDRDIVEDEHDDTSDITIEDIDLEEIARDIADHNGMDY